MTDPGILVIAVGRTFHRRDVLRDISLEVPRGQTLALVGPNGSGKSTLLEILATLLTPTRGCATVLGLDVVSRAADVRRIVGYAPSNLGSFYPRLSGRRNLEFFAALSGLDSSISRRRVDALLDRVGLDDRADARVQEFSDGMRARLNVARAMLTDAPVLLLDEPTRSLDAEGKADLTSMLLESQGDGMRRTIVWVTHDLSEASLVSSCVAVLEQGAIA